jgi:hypothetical protein
MTYLKSVPGGTASIPPQARRNLVFLTAARFSNAGSSGPRIRNERQVTSRFDPHIITEEGISERLE